MTTTDEHYEIMFFALDNAPYTLKMLGKFSWVIVGWLKKIHNFGNYYPIEPSSDLTNIGQLFLLKY